MKKYKSNFSIDRIGRFRFYIGIVVGIGYSIILSFLFQMLSKTNNVVTAMNDGNWDNLINSKLGFYYTSFFGLLSVSLGFCFTTYLWMSKLNFGKRSEARKLRFAQTNSFFMFGVIMLVLTRFFTIYMGFNYDGFYLDLKEYFGFIAFFLPISIFLYCWSLISKLYQSKKVLLISLLIFGVLGLTLSGIRT
ncbi:hypothetical protein [Snuella sedimenti]|uniref:Uncharacterized protein n=1 Tax=Snuella sedimenti TaxID=2798802 RepID=A0A8J7IH15_9FLAO|nr:hypothetical protein [Snuella sedimenti]MBJ6367516.1 hypothetical protein [Snuella sedimenti]